jgi:predicted DNA-binding protein
MLQYCITKYERYKMVATVRLDNTLDEILSNLSKNLQKKKSDIIREAIKLYAKNIDNNKKSRILNAVNKTKDIDKSEFKELRELENASM